MAALPGQRPDRSPRTFDIDGDDFVLDGRPFQIISGAIHYFRVHPDQWADRVRKARLMGLNTIETYVPWNLHEPEPGSWTASGSIDLARFLDTIAAEGMYAIVRPGPYICAEWVNGGLPSWLFTDPTVGIRRDEPKYLDAVARFLDHTLAIVAPRQISDNGPVILVQVENEYGAYGRDKTYLRKLVDITRAAGITVPLTTVDQPQDDMLENGTLPDVLATGSFGSRPTERLATLRRHQSTGPLMCSEFWNGWFDSWGSHHHTSSTEQAAADLDTLLAAGASVNLYMFHGGTNFGFTNGADDNGVYRPNVTSYDYDAPLDESGNPTPKYWAFRDAIARHAPVPSDKPESARRAPEIRGRLNRSIPLGAIQSRLGDWVEASELRTFDASGHFGSFGMYSTRIDTVEPSVLQLGEVRDRAYVYVDHTPIGVLARDHHQEQITLPAGGGTLNVLVEDQGRVCYGRRIGEPKGLVGPAFLNGRPLTDWEFKPLDLSSIAAVESALTNGAALGGHLPGPAFASGSFMLEAPEDLHLNTAHWGKGVAWVNGFNLGRYWSRGPQLTLYVPGPILRGGVNTITILELEGTADTTIHFTPDRELGPTEE